MKELTIEEKAKRYDEAIEIARKIKDGESIDAPDGTVIPVVIFPELKEDEDEFTWLKNYISEKVHYLSMDIRDYEDRLKLQKLQKSLAWLEKQGEQKPIEMEEFTSIPFEAYDSELVNETITIPDGCVATIEGNRIHIKKK